MRPAFPIAATLCALLMAMPAQAEPAAAAPLTSTDVEAWLDGLMPYALEQGDIAGAVVVVVKDGQILLKKGYGYSDMAKRTPVDPDRTLFRPGSVSKLFTWTAVMQQVERGKLDLDADVNRYLDYEIPPGPNGEPITLRNLMTHTPGFSESVKELIVSAPDTAPVLGDALKRSIPPRLFPAGTMPAYSNYGAALAGYMVERTSGLSFDDYLEQNIFAPLGMKHASFRQPLPAAMQDQMAQGYEVASGEPQPFEIVSIAPAGSMSTTGADMAAFMIAHLQDGAYGDARILSAETAQKMHGTPLTIIPPLNRMLLGFYETNTNGRRVISHGGDTQYFHSELDLYIDDGVGIFFSFSSTGKEGAVGPLRSAVFRKFSDRYLPGPGTEGSVDAATAARDAKLLAGTYIFSRRFERSPLDLINLASEIKVTANEDGTVTVPLLRGLNGEPRKWHEVAPMVWTDVDGKTRLAAEVKDGRVTRFGFDDYSPFIVFEKGPVARSGAWLLPAAGASLAILLLTVLLWPVAALVRRHYRLPLPLSGRDARAHRWSRIGALATTLAIVAWALTAVLMFKDLTLMTPRLDPWLLILQVLGSIAVFAGLVLTLWGFWVVVHSKRKWYAKVWHALLALATAICTWLAVVYHLVGFTVNY